MKRHRPHRGDRPFREELNWDLSYLMQLWTASTAPPRTPPASPFLIYLESSLVIRAIRDYLQPDIGEILIDTQEIYDQAVAFMQTVMPGNVGKVKLYRDDVPLFSRFPDRAPDRERLFEAGGAIAAVAMSPLMPRECVDASQRHSGAPTNRSSTGVAPTCLE